MTSKKEWLHSLQQLVLNHSRGSIHVIPGHAATAKRPKSFCHVPKGGIFTWEQFQKEWEIRQGFFPFLKLISGPP